MYDYFKSFKPHVIFEHIFKQPIHFILALRKSCSKSVHVQTILSRLYEEKEKRRERTKDISRNTIGCSPNESRGASFVEGILRNISAVDQTIHERSLKRNSSSLRGQGGYTHLVNSHDTVSVVWRSYNFKDLRSDLSQQERKGFYTKRGTWEAECVDREKPVDIRTFENIPRDLSAIFTGHPSPDEILFNISAIFFLLTVTSLFELVW